MRDDIIDDCLRLVREGQPQMSRDALWRLECALRAQFGGKSFCVPKRAAYPAAGIAGRTYPGSTDPRSSLLRDPPSRGIEARPLAGVATDLIAVALSEEFTIEEMAGAISFTTNGFLYVNAIRHDLCAYVT
jgi:hypothetical protein